MIIGSKMNNSYYEDNRKYKPYEVIRDWNLNFNLGNVVKYIARAGRKTDSCLEDLKKAFDYLVFEINAITSESQMTSEKEDQE